MPNIVPILPQIKKPDDVKRLSVSELVGLCDEIRSCLIDTVLVTGGHLASNLGIVELSTALVYVLDWEKDKLIYDVGHQCYTHKLLTGRYDDIQSLRSFGGLSGFQSPNESEYDHFQTGHASTSLSAAVGFARAAKLAGKDSVSFAVIGDGAMTGGLAYEALNDGGASDLPLVVIINDNGMSINKNVGSISRYLSRLRLKKGYIRAKGKYHKIIEHIPFGKYINRVLSSVKEWLKKVFIADTLAEHMGFEYLGNVDGNNVEALIYAISYAKQQKKPVLLHAITCKGKGFAPAETDPATYHGIARVDAVKHTSSYSIEFGKALCDIAEKDKSVCAVSAAMINGIGLTEFAERFPERLFDVGIAEEHAVTMSGAMRLNGARPVVAIYSTFLQRSFDQLLNDITLQKIPLTIVVDRAGLAYEDGVTHHGIYDIGFLSMLKGLSLYAPSSYSELIDMLECCVKSNDFTAIRISRGVEGSYKGNSFTDKKTSVLLESGSDILLISYGNAINRAIETAALLKKDGISAGIVKLNRVIPPDFNENKAILEKCRNAAVIEDCVKAGSIGEKFCAFCVENHVSMDSVTLINVPEVVGHGAPEYLDKLCGIDAESIKDKIIKSLKSVR